MSEALRPGNQDQAEAKPARPAAAKGEVGSTPVGPAGIIVVAAYLIVFAFFTLSGLYVTLLTPFMARIRCCAIRRNEAGFNRLGCQADLPCVRQ